MLSRGFQQISPPFLSGPNLDIMTTGKVHGDMERTIAT
jgi:hypothetical protein